MPTSVARPPGKTPDEELGEAPANRAPHPAQSARRTLALWIPDWPVVAAIQAGSVRPGEPVVLMHDGRVAALSATARQEGVRRGMRRRSAQEVCPQVTVLARQEGYEVTAFEPVAAATERVLAAIEVIRPGLLVAPARGPSRYYGGDRHLAAAVLSAVIADTGHECEVGIADGLLAAVLAARAGALIPPGQASAFLADHPLSALSLALGGRHEQLRGLDDLIGTWNRLGLTTLGALAALPQGQVLARFGPLGQWAWRLARGQDVRVPYTGRSDGEVSADMVLDPPVDNLERAAFAARACAEQLYDLLAARGLGYTRLEVVAHTEDGGQLCRTWRVEGLDAPAVVDRVRWQLEGWLGGRSGQRPTSGLTWMSLVAHDAAPGGAYHPSLWGRSGGAVLAERTAERVDTLLKNDGLAGLFVAVEQGGRDPRSRIRLVSWGDDPVPLRPVAAPWPGRLPEPAPATVYACPAQVDIADAGGLPVRIDIRLALSGEPAFFSIPDAARRPVSVTEQPGGPPGGFPGGPLGGPPGGFPGGPRDGFTAVQRDRPAGVQLSPGRWAISAWAGPWPAVERWWAGQERRVYAQILLGDLATPARRIPGAAPLPQRGTASPAQLAPGALLLVVYHGGTWHLEARYD